MRTLTLLRQTTGDDGTLGTLSNEERGLLCFTIEPPWRDNRTKLSCIPLGTYQAVLTRSPRFGKVYTLLDTPGRSHILIHRGNLGGDIKKGLISHTEGCIILGQRIGTLMGQRAVLASAPAFAAFMSGLDGDPFLLKIDATPIPDKQGVSP